MDKSEFPSHPLVSADKKPVSFRLEVWGNKKEPYDSEKPHRHDYHEVMFFMDGKGTHDIDFRSHETCGGTVHFVHSNNVHMLIREPVSNGISLMFTPDFADQSLIAQLPFAKEQPILHPVKEKFAELTKLVNMIVEECNSAREGMNSVIQSYFNALLWNCARLCKENGDQGNYSRPGLISKFLQLISENYLEHLSVEDYAERLHVSSKHLIELSRNHTGKTPLQNIQDHLISEAKKMLFFTELPVKEVAYKLNFDDAGNFSKFFKSRTGYTPNEYREGIR